MGHLKIKYFNYTFATIHLFIFSVNKIKEIR